MITKYVCQVEPMCMKFIYEKWKDDYIYTLRSLIDTDTQMENIYELNQNKNKWKIK